MHATEILFPGHVRLSTWIAMVAFVWLAARRRDRVPILAAVAWLCGFEAVFQIVDVAEGFPLHWPSLQFFVLMTSIAVTVLVAGALTWRGVRPNLRVLGLALAVFVVWVALGFHVNYHNGQRFDAAAEVLNETSKMLWAAAYLVPLTVVAVSPAERHLDAGTSA